MDTNVAETETEPEHVFIDLLDSPPGPLQLSLEFTSPTKVLNIIQKLLCMPEEKARPKSKLKRLGRFKLSSLRVSETFPRRDRSWRMFNGKNAGSKLNSALDTAAFEGYLESHWSLLTFCHFGESLHSENITPCMLPLDSLKMTNPRRLEPEKRKFVLDVYMSEGRPEDKQLISRIPLLVPTVPQQRNGEECGNHVVHFINLFVQEAPENFSMEDYPYFMKDNWFSPEGVEDLCERLNPSQSEYFACLQ